MELQIEKTKNLNVNVRLTKDLNDFVNQISKELDCTKSEAIRSMIKACRAGFKKEGE